MQVPVLNLYNQPAAVILYWGLRISWCQKRVVIKDPSVTRDMPSRHPENRVRGMLCGTALINRLCACLP